MGLVKFTAIMEVFPLSLPFLTLAPLFPTWHRPYVALYEQLLVSHFDTIIGKYSGSVSDSLRASAQKWRLPYWEWAVDEPAIPKEWISETIKIWDTTGKEIDYKPNPFQCYNFQKPLDPSFSTVSTAVGKYFGKTQRWPSTADGTAVSQPDEVTPYLKSRHLKKGVWSIFGDAGGATPWNDFSNDAQITAKTLGPMTSLESVHGSVHIGTGGVAVPNISPTSGHMRYVPVSGFDPIFWMHHCQVERLLSLWQAVYWKVKVSDTPTDAGNQSFNIKTDEKIAMGLLPFRKKANEYVTSNDIQSTTMYGYIYPEIYDAGDVNPQERSRRVFNAVENLYGGSKHFYGFQSLNQ